MNEIWKDLIYDDIPKLNRFAISSLGRLKNKKTNHIYKTHLNKEGYLQVCVSLGSRKKKKNVKVHIAVAKAFVKILVVKVKIKLII